MRSSETPEFYNDTRCEGIGERLGQSDISMPGQQPAGDSSGGTVYAGSRKSKGTR